MFPIWDDQVEWWHRPYFTRLFIIINVVVFFYQASLGGIEFEQFVMTRGAIPSHILSWADFHTLFTSMFLHGSWLHLIGNMLFLYVFGDNIEARMWSLKFLLFYLIWWLAAHAGHILVGGASDIPTVGASGCISAILGAYLIMYPNSRIKMLLPQSMRVVLVGASQFLVYWIVLQFVSGIGGLGGAEWGGVARWAHVGWFAAGVLLGFAFRKAQRVWKKKNVK